MQVKFKPNAKSGKIVNAYQSNPKFGFINLIMLCYSFVDGWMKDTVRSVILRGEVEKLQAMVDANQEGLPGRIQVLEFYKGEPIPDNVLRHYFSAERPFGEYAEEHIKLCAKGGIPVTHEGREQLRFSMYDQTGEAKDVLLPHDNVAEIRDWFAAHKAITAETVEGSIAVQTTNMEAPVKEALVDANEVEF